ncbi:hypothetical protein GCM10009764_78510 [Nocardia ninae]|uniref:Uncharacterized protein n=2 Tax=Nocardia ninae TaxID=356145 RepID=A0A511MED9_9NOCA|nr:hypothetical protein NN4_29770 [Nocardia ninae NBRC 108245]
MKITRDFEEELLRRVRKGLSEPNPKPLILMGQTATGKSMALCQLAIEIARAGQFAVLHQSRRGERPNLSDIDRFCAWAEENSLPAVLLIWDGMESPDEYYGLNNDLRARGRRVQIVGSSYKLRRRPKSEIISASPDLSEAEITEMKAWLRRFKIPTPELSDHELESSLLALLYRALPQTERGLRRGLSMEMRASEFGLEKQARSLDRTEVGCYGAVAHALLVAGYEIKVFVPSDHPDEEMKSLHFDQRSTAEQLTAVVLVAGRRGLPVPLELLLRIIGRAGVNQIVDLVTSFDIFRWTEDENSGEQYIGSRTQLEAELLARENITLESEVEILAQYITEIHADSTLWGGREVEFIVDLIGRIGPQAAGLNNSSEYSRYYGALADSLRDRRERGAPGHPRLVLLEANLRREYVVKNKRDLPKFDERLRILEYSRCLLEATAYEDNVGKRTRLFLLVELASTVGAEIYELTANSVQPDRVMNLMERVVEISLEARALDPENVYPVDVVAWVSDNLVRKSNLTPVDRVRVLADADASLDSFDSELLNPGQRANYLQRRANIASLMQDQARESNYLDVLRQSGDPAAYYCLARYEADTGAAGLAAAVERLMTAPAAVRDDWRCSHLLFDLFWRLKAGTPFLSNERIALPFSRADWEECLKITDLITRPARYVRYKVDFLRGISLFHLGNFAISDEVFKSVERQSTDMSRRVLSSYVVSNPDGTAREFTGRVTWAAADGRRGAVWVDQLSVEVNFIPLRFSVSELRKRGDLLPKFHIAFNMRGTIADPIRGSSTRPETRSVK